MNKIIIGLMTASIMSCASSYQSQTLTNKGQDNRQPSQVTGHVGKIDSIADESAQPVLKKCSPKVYFSTERGQQQLEAAKKEFEQQVRYELTVYGFENIQFEITHQKQMLNQTLRKLFSWSTVRVSATKDGVLFRNHPGAIYVGTFTNSNVTTTYDNFQNVSAKYCNISLELDAGILANKTTNKDVLSLPRTLKYFSSQIIN